MDKNHSPLILFYLISFHFFFLIGYKRPQTLYAFESTVGYPRERQKKEKRKKKAYKQRKLQSRLTIAKKLIIYGIEKKKKNIGLMY